MIIRQNDRPDWLAVLSSLLTLPRFCNRRYENVRPQMDQTCVLGSVLFAAIVVFGAHASSAAETDDSAMLSVDYEKLVSSADITLNRPVSRREAGLPIGNGRMGSLVWTTPSAMKFQINHTDVYANGGATNSFFHRESDYAFGLGFVDIRFVTSINRSVPASNSR